MPAVSTASFVLALCTLLVLIDLATTPVGSVRPGGTIQTDAGSRPQAEAMRLSPTACDQHPASLNMAVSAADRRRDMRRND